MNVMHDANHESFSSRKWVNRLMGSSIYALAGNVYNWKVQHNVLHHTYTNIQGMDEDIDAGDLGQVMWSIANRVRADRDVIMIPNTRVFALDSVSPIVPGQSSYHRIGTKWMIDATMPASSQEEDRKEFEPAMPKSLDSVNLKDFLP